MKRPLWVFLVALVSSLTVAVAAGYAGYSCGWKDGQAKGYIEGAAADYNKSRTFLCTLSCFSEVLRQRCEFTNPYTGVHEDKPCDVWATHEGELRYEGFLLFQ